LIKKANSIQTRYMFIRSARHCFRVEILGWVRDLGPPGQTGVRLICCQ
jgi:hypothetical protein